MIAIDYETTWDRDRGAGTMGIIPYLRHPETEIVLVSAYWDGGAWVGRPEDAPWGEWAGREWVSHHAAFDRAVFAELKRRGIVPPPITPSAWHCSSGAAAYHQLPRDLAGAAQRVLGVRLDKSLRDDWSRGKTRAEIEADLQWLDFARYALGDAKACYLLAGKLLPKTPELERWAVTETGAMGARGLPVDAEAVEEAVQKLERELVHVQRSIPWAGRDKPTSPKALARACAEVGIPPPPSTAKGDEGFAEWLDNHGDAAPFVPALARYRAVNRALEVVRAMRDRIVDNRLTYGLRYYGATVTGRWSGGDGLNVQNLPRDPLTLVDGDVIDIRSLIRTAPGRVLIVADFAQVEPRVLAWLTGNERMVEAMRSGADLYETHARIALGWTGGGLADENPELRRLAKAQVLGLGYGCGGPTFRRVARALAGLNLTDAEAMTAVRQYRAANPGVVRLWRELEDGARTKAGEDFHVTLPSGRDLRYFAVADSGDGLTAELTAGTRRANIYGGLLCENVVQAIARDLLLSAWYRCVTAGLQVVLHVHDELVIEADSANAEDVEKIVRAAMTTPPEWAEGLPLAADIYVIKNYG